MIHFSSHHDILVTWIVIISWSRASTHGQEALQILLGIVIIRHRLRRRVSRYNGWRRPRRWSWNLVAATPGHVQVCCILRTPTRICLPILRFLLLMEVSRQVSFANVATDNADRVLICSISCLSSHSGGAEGVLLSRLQILIVHSWTLQLWSVRVWSLHLSLPIRSHLWWLRCWLCLFSSDNG